MMAATALAVVPDVRIRERDDFESLAALASALVGVATLDDLRKALSGPLALRLPSRDVSVLRAAHGTWEPVIGPADAPERIHQYSWTPLVAEGTTIGMLGIGARPLDAADGRLAEGAITLLSLAAQNALVIDNLKQHSVIDSLTGCFNRAHALEVLDAELRRSSRSGLPVSILMIDVDEFKRINDRYGHVPGDAVLTAVAGELHSMLRQSDGRCRLGGDEFLVILPDTMIEDAVRVAESIREAIEQLVVSTVRGKVRITTSIGVAAAGGGPIDVPGFIDRADVALYRAKQAGRNCVQACASSSIRTRQSRLRLAASR